MLTTLIRCAVLYGLGGTLNRTAGGAAAASMLTPYFGWPCFGPFNFLVQTLIVSYRIEIVDTGRLIASKSTSL